VSEPIGEPQLPPGYTFDVLTDADAPRLRGPDGEVIAVFGPGVAREAVERMALAHRDYYEGEEGDEE
jgi:hypothetical protein